MAAGRMGWTEDEFYLPTPRFFFSAFRGFQRGEMEQARLIALLASKVHATTRIGINDIALFPWEDEADYQPKFANIDPERLAFFSNAEFKALA